MTDESGFAESDNEIKPGPKQNGQFSQFLIIWAGQLVSRLGSGITAFAIGIHLLQVTGSTTAFSTFLLVALLPSVLLAPVGGVLADKWQRKSLMIIADLGSGAGILLIICALLFMPDQFWLIYAGAAISSIFVAFHSPAFKASITDMLDEEAYAKASGMVQLAEASRYLIAPFLAALLMGWFTLPLVLLIDFLSFCIAAMTILLFFTAKQPRNDDNQGSNFLFDLKDGFVYLLKRPFLKRLLMLTTVVTFFVGILQALFTPVMLSLFDVQIVGTAQSLAASGMLIASLLIGMASKTSNQSRVLPVALMVAGLFCLLLGINTDLVLIVLSAFCFFFTLPFINTSLEVQFRRNIENKMQGRVWSLVSLITQVGIIIAFSIAGPLADMVFNPLLSGSENSGRLLRLIVGSGAARGSALMIAISGLAFFLTALWSMIRRNPAGRDDSPAG